MPNLAFGTKAPVSGPHVDKFTSTLSIFFLFVGPELIFSQVLSCIRASLREHHSPFLLQHTPTDTALGRKPVFILLVPTYTGGGGGEGGSQLASTMRLEFMRVNSDNSACVTTQTGQRLTCSRFYFGAGMVSLQRGLFCRTSSSWLFKVAPQGQSLIF